MRPLNTEACVFADDVFFCEKRCKFRKKSNSINWSVLAKHNLEVNTFLGDKGGGNFKL